MGVRPPQTEDVVVVAAAVVAEAAAAVAPAAAALAVRYVGVRGRHVVAPTRVPVHAPIPRRVAPSSPGVRCVVPPRAVRVAMVWEVVAALGPADEASREAAVVPKFFSMKSSNEKR